ncbi:MULTISPECIES: heat-inducible transcriptional repressor HrcA [Allobacillus]|uniref:Heat-inducible transcription repressor HrcA n=1 Tax=Allobacillus salarius TaxID=1955272 RepID=A0A556PTP4_9BACI|nr:heat-inducible transcriptional repressor HrcA [Allobacillus salarius]TSJ67757.1 heat-inducible transcriptional repressor HrcA [Allobacillus salarius]
MLTDRQLLILKVIVDEFVDTAQPIGSRNIAKKDQVGFSPATIRNEMADLEELGFLQKTHSSSGRMPSEKGYRFYVDHLMDPLKLTKDEIKRINKYFSHKMIELERVMESSANILSELTQYMTLVLGPEIFETKLKQVQIVPLNQHSAIAILVTDTGHVEHRSFVIPKGLDQSDLEKTVNILNEKLVGVPLVYLDRMIKKEIRGLIKQYTSDYSQAYQMLEEALLIDLPTNLYVSGKGNMLNQPEFNDIEKIKILFSMMESEERIAPLLKSKEEGTHIFIGRENKIEALNDLSLITSTYTIGEDQVGTIALLGPTRMDYAKAVAMLQLWSKQMSHSLKSWYDEN